MPKPSRRVASGPAYCRILWPTDFSAMAQAVLPYALYLAGGAGAELVLLHVVALPWGYAGPEVPGALWREFQKNRAAAREELRRLAVQLKVANLHVHTVVAEGVPFAQICRIAKRLRCDLITIATHGRTGLHHALMGSVTEQVVRWAPCPVLTVRPSSLAAPAPGRGETNPRAAGGRRGAPAGPGLRDPRHPGPRPGDDRPRGT